MCQKITGFMVKSVDSDQTPRSAASDLDLHLFIQASLTEYLDKYRRT